MFDQLARMPELIIRCCDDLLDRLAELVPNLGQVVATDSSTIEAYANPNRKHTVRDPDGPADVDASWTKKNSARDPSQEEWVFGYKAHVVANAKHDVLLGMIVTTAKSNDSPSEHPWFSLPAGAVVIAARGYASKDNNEFVHRNGGITVILKRRLPEGKLHDDVYTAEGVPTCLGGREIAYVCTDPNTGHHLYRCSEGGCPRRDTAHAVSACDDESWESPEANIRLFGGAIRRGSPEWKAMHSKWWSVERVFSR